MLSLDIQGQGPSALALRRMLQREGWLGDIAWQGESEADGLSGAEGPSGAERESIPDPSGNAARLGALAQRSLALSAGSLQLIKRCTGSLPSGADIACVEVQIGTLTADRIGQGLVMRHDELGLERLGRVVTWSNLVEHLKESMGPLKEALQMPAPDRHRHRQDKPIFERVVQNPSDASPVWRIKVWADGDPGNEVLEADPHQSAIVGRVEVRGAPQGWALERFLPEGPLALLPDQQSRAMQLVWCAEQVLCENRFRALQQNDSQAGQTAVLRTLNMALPKGIEITAFDKSMQCIRLKRRARAQMLRISPESHRVDIWIANAAQSLHPVAGQGLNLGLRDAAELARCLVTLQHNNRQARSMPSSALMTALRVFEQHRQRDRWLLMQITDQLAKQSTRCWFQAWAPHAMKFAAHNPFKRFIMQTFAFGPREPWPLWH
jgi:2-octaprenyl-6-methoxyphenol hydroxylase